MKIGIFDSGLGGLIIAKSLFKTLPKYDYIYLGDTKNLPYGNKSKEQIYKYTLKAVKYLFKHNCKLVIIACNTSSALTLRKIQQEFQQKQFPKRRVIGVIVPTLEVADKHLTPLYKGGRGGVIGVIGTTATIRSHKYKKELTKIDTKAKILEIPTPDLVPLIEKNSLQQAKNRLKLYLKPLLKQGIEALILGCTHYSILKKTAKQALGKKVAVISQDEIIPFKLFDYLRRHKEIDRNLTKKRVRTFYVTKLDNNFSEVAKRLFGKNLNFKLAKY